jgi:hypothetical protein
MNERIRELAEQASQYANEQNELHGVGYVITFKEKFAQLIIGHAIECVRDVLRDENSDLSYGAASQVQNRIKQHFGVEE